MRDRGTFLLPSHTAVLAAVFLIATVFQTQAQVRWLEDASVANTPDGPLAGQMKGTGFSGKYGDIRLTGGITLGSPETSFDHYTLRIGDGNSQIDSKFTVEIMISIRKGERPDGRTFKKPGGAVMPERPVAVRMDELFSMRMIKWSGGTGNIDVISGSAEMPFSGTVIFGERKDLTVPTSLYLCFMDKLKSCVAGKINLSVK